MPIGSWVTAPSFGAGADGVHLLLAGVIADHHELAFHLQLFHGVQHTDDRAFVGAEVTLQVRVGSDDGLGNVGRFGLVASAVLGGDDL